MSKSAIQVENLHIIASEELPTPAQLKKEMPLQGRALDTVLYGHKSVKDILDGNDQRLLVIVGPCSIHDTKVAMDYA